MTTMTSLPPFPGSPEYFRRSTATLRPTLNPIVRVALIAVAVAGTVTYGVHVADRFARADLAWLGPGIAWGAGVSWAVLAALTALKIQNRQQLGRLADHALVTLTLGMVGVLTALALTKTTAAPPVPTHLALLGLSNVAMGAYFIARAPAAGLKRGVAAAIWIGLMNGVLAAGVLVAFLLRGAA